MAENYSALSGGTSATNGGLGGGQYSSANNVGTFTPSNGAGLVQKAYDRLVEFALRSQPLLRSVADKRPARQSMPGSSVVFQIYSDMSKATTALSEQVDPDSVAIGTPTAVTVTLNEYGNAVLTTRKLQLMSLAEVDPAIANIVAFNMADSIDELVQTELRGGTNVIYASNASGTRLYNATDGGSSARVFRTLLAGQQALAEAVAEEPHVVIGNVTDKLMRLRPIGWYGVLGFKRYREEALYRIESSSSINAS